MRLFVLGLSFIFGVLLAACGKTDFNRDQAKIDAGNVSLARMSQIREDLRAQRIELMPESKRKNETSSVDEMKSVVSECSENALLVLKPLADEYVDLGSHVTRLIDDGDVTYAGDLEALHRSLRLARALKAELVDALSGH